jgi:hypothetical protein
MKLIIIYQININGWKELYYKQGEVAEEWKKKYYEEFIKK